MVNSAAQGCADHPFQGALIPKPALVILTCLLLVLPAHAGAWEIVFFSDRTGNGDLYRFTAAGEPEILLDTMHHAREIMSGEFGILWADYLCSNYGSDPVVTWLMDNRELYLISIVNPDGVVYNETTNPQGGGLWRKNRRFNGSSYGVDLNRNYPYEWGGSGSSGGRHERLRRLLLLVIPARGAGAMSGTGPSEG